MIDDELIKKNKEEEKIINNKYKLIEDLYAIKLIPKKN